MKYQILIEKPAQKFIAKLPLPDRKRIIQSISQLPKGNIKLLKGHSNLYRLRVGDYRILYTINNNELIITIIDAGNRGQIYNNY